MKTLAEKLLLDTTLHSPALQALQDRISEFQQQRFPEQTVAAKLKGMVREVETELLPDLADPKEWADVFIYFLGAAAKNGMSTAALIAATHAKMDINETRKWGAPDAEGVHQHIEEGK